MAKKSPPELGGDKVVVRVCIKQPMSKYLCHLWRPVGRQQRVDDRAPHARTKPLQCHLGSVCEAHSVVELADLLGA